MAATNGMMDALVLAAPKEFEIKSVPIPTPEATRCCAKWIRFSSAELIPTSFKATFQGSGQPPFRSLRVTNGPALSLMPAPRRTLWGGKLETGFARSHMWDVAIAATA